jgi:asparagine synthetase B (glutamine-hydrolysing)
MQNFKNFLITSFTPGPASGLVDIGNSLFARDLPVTHREHFCFFHGNIHNFNEFHSSQDPDSRSPESILIELYLSDPQTFGSKLKGTFCLVIGNGSKIFVLRDGNGYENIYFSVTPGDHGKIIISNSIKEIAALKKPEVNTGALPAYFLKADLNSGETFFRDVSTLAFFEYAVISIADHTVKKGFFENFFIDGIITSRVNINKLVSEFENLTGTIINEKLEQLGGNSRIINALSGGTDSTYIQYFLKEKNDDLAYTANYTVAGMDRIYASDVASLLSLDHRTVESDTEQLISCIPLGIWLCEKPFMFSGETLLLNMYREARNDLEGPVSCFDGAGAEGILGASKILYELRTIRKYRFLFPLLLPVIRLRSEKLYRKYLEFYRLVNKKEIPDDFILRYFTDEKIHKVIKEAFRLADLRITTSYETGMMKIYNTSLFESFYRFLAFEHEFKRTVNVRTQLAKNYNISLVLPFTETQLYRFLLQYDTEIKLRNAKTKYIFRKAMERKFPKSIIYRKKVRKNVSVSDELLKNKKVIELVNEIKNRNYPYFSFNYDEIFSSTKYSTIAYKLINFHIWHRIFIDEDMTGINPSEN